MYECVPVRLRVTFIRFEREQTLNALYRVKQRVKKSGVSRGALFGAEKEAETQTRRVKRANLHRNARLKQEEAR